MEIKNVKVSKLENKELLDVKKQVESFLKFLNTPSRLLISAFNHLLALTLISTS